ncbi:wax ester/triacylglycerol synthase family O-acyltransferase [Rhodococcus sp. X156]|uniref:WS/DGAT/MGAT family O-acyltransferase n=1 Tax=Rhodococcus sp. X156 TaxID=2499145 RepID=UPI000FD83ED1|nr:wax ester/triacylglycerol synthase family O-acyltransferase [Rhodococcus sp. X156]
MEWDELHAAGQTWRLRAQLVDRPGTLAALVTSLSARGCNLLGVSVLPVAGEPTELDQAGRVVDELVLRTPQGLEEAELVALVQAQGARFIGMSPASVEELVDTETTVLRAATDLLAGRCSEQVAMRRVLAADTVTYLPAGATPDTAVPAGGHSVVVRLADGRRLLVRRRWAPFTEGELARIPALLELLAAVTAPTRPVPARAPGAATTAAPPGTPSRGRLVRQLSPLDVQFLNAENATTTTHIGNLLIVDPSEVSGGVLTVAGLRELFRSRLHLAPPLRWRLREVPLGLDLPYWEEVSTLDLDHHVREVALPAPGRDAQLGEAVASLAESPLDRDRPLWESYLVSGLAGGLQAIYTKIHHSVIDGVSGAEIMAAILDLTPCPGPVAPPGPAAPHVSGSAPGPAELAGRGFWRAATLPVSLLRSAPHLVPHVLDVPGAASVPGARALESAVSRLSRATGLRSTPPRPPRAPAPPSTPLNRRITAERTFAFLSVPLDEVKAVKNALGLTVNDVVMAMCTTALRRWLVDHDALPESPLVAGMPVSVRTPEQRGTAGNRISFMLAALPTHEPDPAERVRLLHTSLAAAKERFSGSTTSLMEDASALLPQVLHGVASRALFRAAAEVALPFNLLISNVPGPQLALYAGGARVTGTFPLTPISDVSGGLNITVMSYDGHVDFGFTACPQAVPDVWSLADAVRAALVELAELAVPALTGGPVPAWGVGGLVDAPR